MVSTYRGRTHTVAWGSRSRPCPSLFIKQSLVVPMEVLKFCLWCMLPVRVVIVLRFPKNRQSGVSRLPSTRVVLGKVAVTTARRVPSY